MLLLRTPQNVPSGTIERTIVIPAHVDWLSVINGALYALTLPETWEQSPNGLTVEETCDIMTSIFVAYQDS